MNPIRSLAPAIISGQLTDQWIYIVGPLAGAALGIIMGRVAIEGPAETTDE
jgi:aquaporin Z